MTARIPVEVHTIHGTKGMKMGKKLPEQLNKEFLLLSGQKTLAHLIRLNLSKKPPSIFIRFMGLVALKTDIR
jgi:hypothetical protein